MEHKMEVVPSFAHKAGLPFAPFRVLWIPSSARLVALGAHTTKQSGTFHIYKLAIEGEGDKGQLQLVQDSTSVPGSQHALQSGLKCATCELSDRSGPRLLAVGDFEGRARVWDVDRLSSGLQQPVFEIEQQPDKQIINSIAALPCNLLLTGSRDGQACVWDVRQRGKSNAAIARLAFPENDCWAVVFGSAESKSFIAGYDDGMVYLSDLRMNGSPRWQHHLASSQGVCSVAFHNGKLLATTVQDQFTLFDFEGPLDKPVMRRALTGRPSIRPAEDVDATTWDVKFNPHNPDYFMTSAGNGYLDLYQLTMNNGRTGIEPIASKAPSTQPVLSLDWHKDREGLFAFGSLNDNSIRVGFVPTSLR